MNQLKKENDSNDLSGDVLSDALLKKYTTPVIMPSHKEFKETVREDIAVKYNEERLRRIVVSSADASPITPSEPYVFSKGSSYNLIEKEVNPVVMNHVVEEDNGMCEEFLKTVNVFVGILNITNSSVNMMIEDKKLKISNKNDFMSADISFDLDADENPEKLKNIIKRVSSILDTCTESDIFSKIESKIK